MAVSAYPCYSQHHDQSPGSEHPGSGGTGLLLPKDSNALMHVQEALWDLGFKPDVFKKRRKESKGKGVDIALTKDVLSNAFLNNYDVAVIMTGDADYRPVIDELKRLGKTVCIMAFTEGAKVNRELKLSADFFMPLVDLLLQFWSTDRIMADLQ